MELTYSGPYDVVLKRGRVIDPAPGLDGICGVRVNNGRIAAIGQDRAGPARKTTDVRGVKGHPAIGGFTHWGDEPMHRTAIIGGEPDTPLASHLGQLWPPQRFSCPTKSARRIQACRPMPRSCTGRCWLRLHD